MKKLLIISILLLSGCLGLGSKEVYLPHTSRVFHAKKSCPGCNDINPIIFQSLQNALNSSGISPCSVCIKDKHYAVKGQGYSVTNYATSGTGGGTAGRFAPSSIGSSVISVIKATSKAYVDSAPDREARRQRRQQLNNQREIENQMRRQTAIMQEQLDRQEKVQRQQSIDRMKFRPTPMIDPPAYSPPAQFPSTYNNQWQPTESQFDFKSKGILDGY